MNMFLSAIKNHTKYKKHFPACDIVKVD